MFNKIPFLVKSFMFWDVRFKGKLEVGLPQRSADSIRVLI